jgi:hypothetical protein
MMQEAGRYHALRAVLLAALLVLLGWGAVDYLGGLKARALRDRLLAARLSEVPAVVADLAPYRHWADPLLREAHAAAQGAGATARTCWS